MAGRKIPTTVDEYNALVNEISILLNELIIHEGLDQNDDLLKMYFESCKEYTIKMSQEMWIVKTTDPKMKHSLCNIIYDMWDGLKETKVKADIYLIEIKKDYERDSWDDYFEEETSNLQEEIQSEEFKRDLKLVKELAVEQSEKYKLKRAYMNLFNHISVGNELFGEITYHSLIGLCCKGLTIPTEIKSTNLATHCIVIKPSGTGKDQALNFFLDLLKRMNVKIEEYNRKNKNNTLELYNIYELSGAESVEAFLDHYQRSPKGYKFTEKIKDEETGETDIHEVMPSPGLFSTADILIARECSYLFREKSADKQRKSELLLLGMEGAPIEKSLVGWEGRKTSTNPQFTFIGVTRPIENMKSTIAGSGFLQRSVPYCAVVSDEDRMKVTDHIAVLKSKSEKEVDEFAKKMDKLSELFMELRIYAQNNLPHISLKQQSTITKLMVHHIHRIQLTISNEIKSNEYREILYGFVARYAAHSVILAHHNAISRYSQEIEPIDYEQAFSLLQKSFDHLMMWIFESISEDKETVKKEYVIEQTVRNLFKQKNTGNIGMHRDDLIAELSYRMNWCRSTCISRLNRLSQGDFALLEMVQKDGKTKPARYFLRKPLVQIKTSEVDSTTDISENPKV